MGDHGGVVSGRVGRCAGWVGEWGVRWVGGWSVWSGVLGRWLLPWRVLGVLAYIGLRWLGLRIIVWSRLFTERVQQNENMKNGRNQ